MQVEAAPKDTVATEQPTGRGKAEAAPKDTVATDQVAALQTEVEALKAKLARLSKENEGLRDQVLSHTMITDRRGVFTRVQYKRLLTCVRADKSVGNRDRHALAGQLVENERRLVKLSKEEVRAEKAKADRLWAERAAERAKP